MYPYGSKYLLRFGVLGIFRAKYHSQKVIGSPGYVRDEHFNMYFAGIYDMENIRKPSASFFQVTF